MTKVKVSSPIVEIDGDEMARVMWRQVREKLILPYVDVDLKYYDLSLENRDRTDDAVTLAAAHAAKEYGVSIKCSTITPNQRQVEAFALKRAYPSPNGVIRNILDGTLFREPIICKNVPRLVSHWSKPTVIARHAFGEQYKSQQITVPGAGKVKLVYEPDDGGPSVEKELHSFHGPGVALGIFNVDESIRGFARACFSYGLQRGYPVYFSHKATVLKEYDGRFLEIFRDVFDTEFATAYRAADLKYEPRLIDDMVASNLKRDGGYLWACKNYDGDVQSDAVAQGYGSPGLMTSMLMSPDGQRILTETAHGTVARHLQHHRNSQGSSTNPLATIFAWTRGLAHRGRLDGTSDIQNFSALLEKTAVDVVESGQMTQDLAALIGDDSPWMLTSDFIDAVAAELDRRTSIG